MTLHIGEWMVLAMIIAMPIYSLWDSDKSKQAVLAGRKTKLRMYWETIIFLWVPTIALLALVVLKVVPASDIGLAWQSAWYNWAGAGLVLLVASYMVWHIYSLIQARERCVALREAMQTHRWMMPENARELRWFTFGVSVSAGVCEELLFRGFLLAVLSQPFGVPASLLISSLLFGVCHLYQGWPNVIRTGVIGLLLGCIYLFTESLWVVIALHGLVDIYGGIMGYLVNKTYRNDSQTSLVAANT